MNPTDPLAELRDIHLPDPVSWWPPAPGWWIAAVIVLAGTVWAIHRLIRLWRREAPRRIALRELRRIADAYAENNNTEQLAQNLSQLLRRFALARFDRHTVAGLCGEPWRVFLDTHSPSAGGPVTFGEKMITSPYRRPPIAAGADLIQDARKWLRTAGKPEQETPE